MAWHGLQDVLVKKADFMIICMWNMEMDTAVTHVSHQRYVADAILLKTTVTVHGGLCEGHS